MSRVPIFAAAEIDPLEWLQRLEIKRNEAKIEKKIHLFEALSHEIGITLAGKYGPVERPSKLSHKLLLARGLHDYAADHIEGTQGAIKSLSKANELFTELLVYHHEILSSDFSLYLSELTEGTDSNEENARKFIDDFKKFLRFNFENDKQTLAAKLYARADTLMQGSSDLETDLPQIISTFRELFNLRLECTQEKLAATLNSFAIKLMKSPKDIEKTLQAIELFRESVVLGCESAKTNLAKALYNHSVSFMKGTTKDLPQAILLLRESIQFGGCEYAQRVLAQALHSQASELLKSAEINDNFSEGISMLGESISLGRESAEKTLKEELKKNFLVFIDKCDWSVVNQLFPTSMVQIKLLLSKLDEKRAKKILAIVVNDCVDELLTKRLNDFSVVIMLIETLDTLDPEIAKAALERRKARTVLGISLKRFTQSVH